MEPRQLEVGCRDFLLHPAWSLVALGPLPTCRVCFASAVSIWELPNWGGWGYQWNDIGSFLNATLEPNGQLVDLFENGRACDTGTPATTTVTYTCDMLARSEQLTSATLSGDCQYDLQVTSPRFDVW